MWLFTNFGFFSVVQKHGEQDLTIRARVAADLDRLREKYLPELSATISKEGTDYPFRARVNHPAFAEAAKKIALDIDYSNFKSEVSKSMGSERSHIYSNVWSALLSLEGVKESPTKASPKPHSGLAPAFGGVVIDKEGRVPLFEPRGHFDGFVWTFPKGRPEAGEQPAATALREVKEETGLSGEIIGEIPGEYPGGTTINRYFLMQPLHHGKASTDETQSICWVGQNEARERIQMTKNPNGQKRDLAVLEAGYRAYGNIHTKA